MIVGTSGKRQGFQVKQDNRDAKKQRVDIDQNVTCASCKRRGHKTSRSPKCPNHKATKLEVMVDNLGGGFQTFTRKIPLDSCVQQQYKSVLKNRILSASEDVRQLLFRAQLFVNYYIILLEDFTYDEVESVYRPAFIDPGRKAVFTAAVGLGDDHQVRRCSTKEYYDLTGSTKYAIKLQNLKNEAGITPIEAKSTIEDKEARGRKEQRRREE